MGSTTVTIRKYAIAAGCARHDTGYRADSLRCRPHAPGRSTPGRLPHAPGRSLAKRCRPVVLPTCPAAGQLPAGCPTLPAGHSGSVAGPWCCRRAPRPVNSRPVAPRSRPVTRGALPAPWCCRSRSAPRSRPVVLPTCPAAGQLPAGCRWQRLCGLRRIYRICRRLGWFSNRGVHPFNTNRGKIGFNGPAWKTRRAASVAGNG